MDEITEPLLACPNDPDDVKPLSEVETHKLAQVGLNLAATDAWKTAYGPPLT